MVDMVKREIIPAVEAYAMELARTASAKKRVDETLACRYESGLIKNSLHLQTRWQSGRMHWKQL